MPDSLRQKRGFVDTLANPYALALRKRVRAALDKIKPALARAAERGDISASELAELRATFNDALSSGLGREVDAQLERIERGSTKEIQARVLALLPRAQRLAKQRQRAGRKRARADARDPRAWTGASPGVKKILQTKLTNNVKLIKSIGPDLLDGVEKDLKTSFAAGSRPETIAARLTERYGVAESRATRIARDQTGKLQSQVQNERLREIGVRSYIWRARPDSRVRPMHKELDGTEQSYDDPPVTNEDGDTNNPGEDYQCLPGDTKIALAGFVGKAFRRWYCGKLTELVTDSGITLYSTPNHPVLTDTGWQPAQRVYVGARVIQVTHESNQLAETEVENRDAAASDVFEALQLRGKTSRARGVVSQFHSDGSDQHVDVVDTDPVLLDDNVSTPPQRRGELDLPRPNTNTVRALASLRYGNAVCGSLGFTAHSVVRSGSQLASLLWRRVRHTDKHCGGQISNRDSSAHQHTRDTRTCNAESGSDLFDGSSSEVERNSPDFVECWVASVSQVRWEGWVYNFSTHAGWYSANNLIVHNCRCTAEPKVDDALDALIGETDAPADPKLEPEEDLPAAPVETFTVPRSGVDVNKALQGTASETASIETELFGARLSDAELNSLLGYDQQLPGGITASVNYVSEVGAYTTKKGTKVAGNMKVFGSFRNKNGTVVGTMSRKYIKDGSKIAVEHSTFFLDADMQGSGIGREVFNKQIDGYVKRGDISKVSLTAAEVGKYVWTKAGFGWDDIADFVKVKGEVSAALVKQGTRDIDAILDTLKTPQDISRLEVGGERIGKKLLIEREDYIEMSAAPDKIGRL